MCAFRNGFLSLLAVLVLGLLPGAQARPSIGVDLRRGDTVTVGPNEVVDQDIVILSRTATVEGTINGDLFLVAATQARITGTVNGRIIWLGRALTLTGKVSESLYGVGLQLTLDPTAVVGGDLSMVGSNLQSQPGSQVQGSLAMGGNGAVLAGTVQHGLRFTGRALSVTGQVGGVTTVWVPPSGLLKADSMAHAPREAGTAATSPGAVGPAQEGETTGSPVLDWFLVFLRALITLLVVGALALWLFPARFTMAAAQVRVTPLAAVGWGFLVWLGGWVAAVLGAIVVAAAWLILLTATLESLAWWVLVVGGAAWALAFAFFLLLVALVSKVVVAYLVGRLILDRLARPSRERRAWSLLIGVIIYLLLRAIPYFGWVVGVVATLLGLGGIWLSYYRRQRRAEPMLPADRP